MYDSFNITSPSPNTQHTAHFVASGEIRFGPLYYSLSVDDYAFDQRIFGDAHLWAPSSKLLAVQEWLTLDYAEGPITALVLIDLVHGRETVIARATKAFIVPEEFNDSTIVYRVDAARHDNIQHFAVDTTEIQEWNSLT